CWSSWYNYSETMKRKKISNREFFERHREQFERTDRLFRDWLARYEARQKAERAERGEPEEQPGTSWVAQACFPASRRSVTVGLKPKRLRAPFPPPAERRLRATAVTRLPTLDRHAGGWLR